MSCAAPAGQQDMETLALRVRPPLSKDDVPGLCARTCALLAASSPALVRCDVTGLRADAAALDALARLCLATRRRGARLELHGDSPDLGAFLAFAGLQGILS